MTLYITPDNKLHDDDDGKALHLLPSNAVLATQEEINAILNPPETNEQIIARLENALDRHLDSVANSYRYESIRTMVSYVGDTNPQFNAEGTAAFNWRSAVYTLGIQLIAEVTNGTREVPTEEELIALMPTIEQYLQY